MNILSGVDLLRKRKAAQIGSVALTAAQVGSVSMAMSISDIIQNGDTVKSRKALALAFDQINRSLRRLNSQKIQENEEQTIMQSIGKVVKDLLWDGLKRVTKMLFSVIFRAVRLVAQPIFKIFFKAVAYAVEVAITVLRRVLTNPYALAASAAVVGVAYLWLNRKITPPSHGMEGEPDELIREEAGYVSTVPESVVGTARGLRNNNPGNIVFAGQEGAARETSGKFAVFKTQAEGLYALGRQLELYSSRGINTLDKIISKYAPAHENNTVRYIATVAKRMGVNANTVLDLTDRSTLRGLMEAIIRFENGSQPYSDAQLEESVTRAIRFAKINERALAAPTQVAGGEFINPLPGGRVSSLFGRREKPMEGASTDHQGVDIAAEMGTPILAANSGHVTYSGFSSGYGTLITIDHGNGVSSLYGHARKLIAMVGDDVVRGQKIGEVGNMGVSTGPHLHFEIQNKGVAVDPARYITSFPSRQQDLPAVATPKKSEVKTDNAATPTSPAPSAPAPAPAPSGKSFIKKKAKLIRVED